MKKMAQGFTIVELVIVIVIIGILSTITILGFQKIQTDSRDSERSAKIRVIAEALEKYYDANGEYPGCSAMTQSPSTVTSSTLVGMDPSNLTAPLATSGTNSFGCTALTTSITTDSFAYVGDSSTACSTGTACLQYTLQYKSESSGTIISLNSRRVTKTSSILNLNKTTLAYADRLILYRL